MLVSAGRSLCHVLRNNVLNLHLMLILSVVEARGMSLDMVSGALSVLS